MGSAHLSGSLAAGPADIARSYYCNPTNGSIRLHRLSAVWGVLLLCRARRSTLRRGVPVVKASASVADLQTKYGKLQIWVCHPLWHLPSPAQRDCRAAVQTLLCSSCWLGPFPAANCSQAHVFASKVCCGLSAGIPGSVEFVEGQGGLPSVLLKHACGASAQVRATTGAVTTTQFWLAYTYLYQVGVRGQKSDAVLCALAQSCNHNSMHMPTLCAQ